MTFNLGLIFLIPLSSLIAGYYERLLQARERCLWLVLLYGQPSASSAIKMKATLLSKDITVAKLLMEIQRVLRKINV